MNPDRFPLHPILLIDDEQEALMGCEFMLEVAGLTHIQTCQDSREVMTIMQQHPISAILLDLSMPYITGRDLLPQLVERYPDTPIIIVTGMNEVETAIECMKDGAFDYLLKPVDETRLISALRRAIDLGELQREYTSFKDRVFSSTLEHPEAFTGMITRNRTMFALFQYMETIAVTNRPVLITGETGTGKELTARALHQLSGRSGAFVALNIAGLDDTVFSDTLFGHVKGAFTGADVSRPGLIQKATGGTLFLDEIGDMPVASQIKLLRLLQEKEYFPIGADAAKPLEARIVTATNRDLQQLQTEGTFRSDLYYRLKTHAIALPPLRRRLDDLPLLIDSFLEQAAESLNKPVPTIPRELYNLLATYHFPGNIRELEAMIFEALSRHNSHMLSCATLREHIRAHTQDQDLHPHLPTPETAPFTYFDRLPTLSEAPRLLILEALKRCEGNRSMAANLLGITRSGLSKAIKRYGLEE